MSFKTTGLDQSLDSARQSEQTLLVEYSALDEEEALEDGALVADALAVRRHGARRKAADVRVMSARRHEEDGTRKLRGRRRTGRRVRRQQTLQVHWRDDRQVGQVAPAARRMVREQHVASAPVGAERFHLQAARTRMTISACFLGARDALWRCTRNWWALDT